MEPTKKAILKSKIKITKLNADDYYMAWVHNMEVMLDAKELLRHTMGTEHLPDSTKRPKDHKVWCFDD